MVTDIDIDSLRRELISLYESLIVNHPNIEPETRTKIENLYNEYHRPAGNKMIPEDLCLAISNLCGIAWEHIREVMHLKPLTKNEMLAIHSQLKKNL